MARNAADETNRADLIESARMDIMEQVIENEGDSLTKEQLHDILEKYFENIPDVYTDPDTKLEENEAWKNFPENFPSADAVGKLTPKPEYKNAGEIEIGEIYTGEFEDSQNTVAKELDITLNVQEMTQNSVKLDVIIKEGNLAAQDTYKYYLNEEPEAKETHSKTELTDSYTYTGLTPDTTYTLKVVVKDADGNETTKTTSATTLEQ